MWCVRLHVKDFNRVGDKVYTREEVMAVLRDIESKDGSFIVKVKDGRVYILCVDKDNAFKRGVWLHSKFGVHFEVEWYDSDKKR